MITVLVEADAASSERLARTLAALVPAVVEGVVLDAVILNVDGSDEVVEIAKAAGATCLDGGDVNAAIEEARGDWLLCLEPGARPQGEWFEVVSSDLDGRHQARPSPARFRPSRTDGLFGLFRRPRALRCGLFIHKRQAAAAKAGTLEALANGRAARRLNAKLVPADG
jgi:hypothetical protein